MNDEEMSQAFMALSEMLTGETGLPVSLGTQFLERLLRSFPRILMEDTLQIYIEINRNGGDIVSGVRDTIMHHTERGSLARELISIWYTGQIKQPSGESEIGLPEHYFSGLLWKCIKAHPPGMSGGGYGYWTEAPE